MQTPKMGAIIIGSILALSACSSTTSTSNSFEIENTKGEKIIFESHEKMKFDSTQAESVSPQEWVGWYKNKIGERNETTKTKIMKLEAKSFSAPQSDAAHQELSQGVFLELTGLVKENQKIDIEGVLTTPGTPEENRYYQFACLTFAPPNCVVKDKQEKTSEWTFVGDNNIPPGISIIGFPEFPDEMPAENAQYYISQDKQSGKFIIENESTKDTSYIFFEKNGNSIVTKTVTSKEGELRSDAYQTYTITNETKIDIPEILTKE